VYLERRGAIRNRGHEREMSTDKVTRVGRKRSRGVKLEDGGEKGVLQKRKWGNKMEEWQIQERLKESMGLIVETGERRRYKKQKE